MSVLGCAEEVVVIDTVVMVSLGDTREPDVCVLAHTGSHDGSLHIWGMDGKVVKVR